MLTIDKYKIDSHKLIYHVSRVNDWLEGKNIYPIYMEISPSGSCNHRCVYCALDFMEYKRRYLDTKILKQRLAEMGKLGAKSIMYAGEGEPFLHPDIDQIIMATKKAEIDVAVTTNGVNFDTKHCNAVLKFLSWMKVSIDAAKKTSYAKIHRAPAKDFDLVIKNMSYAAQLKRSKRFKCALGMQIVLLPDNYKEVVPLAKLTKDIGMDYLVVKPYSQHPLSKTTKYKNIKYSKYLKLAEELNRFNSKDFNVVFRIHAMEKWDKARHSYQHCLALPFWAYIDSRGDVWACSIYLTDERFHLGNINKNTFQYIWESEKRRELARWGRKELDTGQCRINCRMDEVNSYLWELTHPPEHVNFI